MIVVLKCKFCSSIAEFSKGYQKALCFGGCPEAILNEDNFEIYSVEGNIIEWVQWVRNGEMQG